MPEYIKLPADLPENWKPNQTITPNGVEGGLTEKHGYNYAMKQINAAQKEINEKLLDPETSAIGVHNTDPLAHPYSNPDMPEATNVAQAIDLLSEIPEKIALTLQDGMINTVGVLSTYCKTKNGITSISINIEKRDGSIFEHADVIGTLPEGYRNPNVSAFVVMGQTSATTSTWRVPCMFQVIPDGQIRFLGSGDPKWPYTFYSVYGDILFL